MAYTILPSVKPTAVRNLAVSSLGLDSAALEWDSPLGNAMPNSVGKTVTHYSVSVHEYAEGAVNPVVLVDIKLVPGSMHKFVLGAEYDVKPATTYTFSVYAINGEGVGPVSMIHGTTLSVNGLDALPTCDACSGHGACGSNGLCTCDKGFSGSKTGGGLDCSVAGCSTEAGDCDNHGTCASNVCSCQANFFGRRCNIDRNAPSWIDPLSNELPEGKTCQDLQKATLVSGKTDSSGKYVVIYLCCVKGLCVQRTRECQSSIGSRKH